MAITHQSTAGQQQQTGGAAPTIASVVVDSGSDRYMVVRVGGEGDGTASQCEISTMTYGGVSLTRAARAERSDWSWAEIWTLDDPAVGSASLVLTHTENDAYLVRVDVYQGVDSLRASPATATGSGTTATVTEGDAASGDLVLDVVSVDGGGKTLTAGANQTQDFADTGLSDCDAYGSSQAGADGGVMSWTWSGSSPWSIVAVALVAASGGPTPVTSTRQVTYDVQNQVTSSRQVTYDVQNAVVSSRQVTYDVQNAVVSSRVASYDVVNQIISSRAVSYDVQNQVTSTREVSYDVQAAVVSTREASWDVANTVASSREVSYDVEGDTTAVVSDREVTYDVQASTVSTREVTYDVQAAVVSSRTTSWDVQAAVVSSRQVTYDVVNAITSSRLASYDVGDVIDLGNGLLLRRVR